MPATWEPGPVADCWVWATPGPATADAWALRLPTAWEIADDGAWARWRPAGEAGGGATGGGAVPVQLARANSRPRWRCHASQPLPSHPPAAAPGSPATAARTACLYCESSREGDASYWAGRAQSAVERGLRSLGRGLLTRAGPMLPQSPRWRARGRPGCAWLLGRPGGTGLALCDAAREAWEEQYVLWTTTERHTT